LRGAMKAVQFSQFGGPEVLEVVELPDPHPAAGQIREAHAVSQRGHVRGKLVLLVD
jgi:hypothetical protein